MSKDKKGIAEKWAWIKEKIPQVGKLIGDVLPEKGVLGVVKNLIDKDDTIPPELKKEALAKIYELELVETQEITKRWQSDNNSDAKLAKVIRPIIMLFLTIFLALVIFIDSSDGIGFEVDAAYIDLLKSLLMLVYFAYFGGRTAEKWKKLNK